MVQFKKMAGNRPRAAPAKEATDGEIQRWCLDIVAQVQALEPAMQSLSDSELGGLTVSFKARLDRGEELDALLPEAFAAAREAAYRTLGQRPFDVQVMGAAVVHKGLVAEMRTGEGKTLTGVLAAYLNALPARGVHVMTANDYLARRDQEWMAPVLRFLGLETGLLDEGLSFPAGQSTRKAAYAADVTYGTYAEFGYDYLRDNLSWSPDECVQRELSYAIIDEADLILVDEIMAPLLITGPGDKADIWVTEFAKIVPRLRSSIHYTTDERGRTAVLTDEGAVLLENWLGIENIYDPPHQAVLRSLLNALRAREFFRPDRDYITQDGQVVPIDAVSGRPHFGRRFSDGIHQAIEAKEGLEVRGESKTLATVEVWDYLGLYQRFGAMTGTAMTESDVYRRIYERQVVLIPTNRPMIRIDHPDGVFATRQAKLSALADYTADRQAARQPVLIGTASIEESAEISRLLADRKIAHEVLTAKNNQGEASVIAEAARPGTVSVVAQMAGRGVDIVLGGSDGIERDAVCAAGGLCVLGAGRSDNRRLEVHLRGRAGRQGDPGESRFYLSFEDDVVKSVITPKVRALAARTFRNGEPFSRLSLALDTVQYNAAAGRAGWMAEQHDFAAVVAEQRRSMYAERRQVLASSDISGQIRELIEDVVREQVMQSAQARRSGSQLRDALRKLYPVGLQPDELDGRESSDSLPDRVARDALAAHSALEARLGAEVTREIERKVMLSVTDSAWRDHLVEMEGLREGIGLRAIGGRSPLAEYRRDAADLIARTRLQIKVRTVVTLFHLEVAVHMPGTG